MNDLTRELIDGFRADGWKSPVYARFLHIVDERRELLPELARAMMDEVPAGGNFQGELVSYLPESELPNLIEHALDLVLKHGKKENRAAYEFLEHAAMQCPWRFHYLLAQPIEWAVMHDEPAACHDMGERYNDVAALIGIAQHSNVPKIARAACRCLLETRDREALDWVVDHQDLMGIKTPIGDLSHEVGFEKRGDDWHRLYPEAHWHMSFPADYWQDEEAPEHLSHARHPTWIAPGEGEPMRFGGAGAGICGGCGETLHHLITFGSLPKELGVSLDRLQLEACLSCLGWETERLFYAHDETGAPHSVGDETARKPEFPVGNLYPTEIKLAATGRRWKWQDWGLTNGRENLHRVGGHPTWIQDADYPKCPQCAVTMQFLMQLDSNLPLQTGDDAQDEWMWGSGGIGYVCWCDACRVSGFEWQCT